MTGQPNDEHLVQRRGDKGEWYLRLLGVEAQGGPTTLQEVTQSRQAAKTSGLVSDMWEQTAELAPVDATDDPLTGWEPTELSRTVTSRRKVRWPIVIIAVLIGAVASFLLWWMPQVSDQRAADHADLMRTSLTELYGDLAEVQQALATATEPTSEVVDLGSVATSLAGIADSAGRLLDVANQAVPSPLPLTAREPFDDLAAARVGLEPLGAEATAIRGAVAEITDYRVALARVLAVGALPLTADSATITEQGAQLARTLADSVAALSLMPTDGAFAEHRTLVEAALTGFAQWQDDYLNALRSSDVGESERLVEELQRERSRLTDQVVEPLAELRTAIDGRILSLAQRLNRAVAALP